MSAEMKRKLKKTVLLAVKIAVGCGIAIYIAEALELEYAVSAGTVTLLSLLGTKWETVKFSLVRLGTFFLTVMLIFLIMPRMHSEWIAYGVIVFLLVFLTNLMGWRATLSVNAIITAHYMTRQDFAPAFLFNEFMLVFIGVVIAIVLNLFHLNKSQKKDLMEGIRYVETAMQADLREVAGYLMGEQMKEQRSRSVWVDITLLEGKLRELMEEAREYQDNTFESHHDYYLDYFEMRLDQCRMLDSLHYEMRKMRSMPKQARVIADYIRYLADYVVEKNVPEKQMVRLNEIFAEMEKEELPESREEFESRALLYHILMDLEEFLKYKQAFVEGLGERQRKEYWE
jgi:Predicted membrane protein